jgi:hypothetical protein
VQERDDERAPDAKFSHLAPGILFADVGVDGAPFSRGGTDRPLAREWPRLFRFDRAEVRDGPVDAFVDQADFAVFRGAQLRCAPHDRIKDPFGVGRRCGDDPQYLARRSLLRPRLLEFTAPVIVDPLATRPGRQAESREVRQSKPSSSRLDLRTPLVCHLRFCQNFLHAFFDIESPPLSIKNQKNRHL